MHWIKIKHNATIFLIADFGGWQSGQQQSRQQQPGLPKNIKVNIFLHKIWKLKVKNKTHIIKLKFWVNFANVKIKAIFILM